MILGGNWLARIGVIALFIGIAFFVKFAIDNRWLGPTSRVALGVVAGLVMIGIGYFWRKKYPTLSQALNGGGIAVLYLSIFSSFAFFHMVNIYAAIFLLLAISVGSAILALRQNSMALAIIGILGAFLAPFILGVFEPGRASIINAGSGLQLLLYVMVVDVGVIVLSTFRNWQWFTLLALFGTAMAFFAWHDEFGKRASLLMSQGSLTILFLIFVGATMLYHIIWKRAPRGFDYALMVINAALYLLTSYGLMWGHFRVWMGGFTLLLALFYGCLAYIASRRVVKDSEMGFFALGIALAFLTIAVPVQFRDHAWTTIAWAAEGTALLWLSFIVRLPLLRYFGFGVLVAMTGRLLVFDTTINIRAFTPVLNERVLAFIFGIAATYLSCYLIWRERKNLHEWWPPFSTLFIAANLFTILLLSLEIWDYFGSLLALLREGNYRGPGLNNLRNAQNLSLTALWAFYALILLVIGIRRRLRWLRLGALALLIAPIIKVFAFDVWSLQLVYRIIAFVGLGLLLLASAYLYQRYSKVIRGFLVNRE